MNNTTIRLFVLLTVLTAVTADSGDWPRYMKDAHRSNRTEEELALPLKLRWTYTPSQRPRPAWPDPMAEASSIDFTFTGDNSMPVILDFDYATHPVVVGNMVYFGSSADDTVRAISLIDGKSIWQFTTGGPIRFAPDISDGRLYVASDDGILYCLDAKTGKEIWQFLAAPEKRFLMGNSRLISRWPLRSGALVVDGAVYVSAGMWPAEGVYMYAVDAKTGKQLWVNDTCGIVNQRTSVYSAYAITGVAPQGYLLAHNNTLVVPTGRSIPSTFSRTDGQLIHVTNPGYQARLLGGHWATISPQGRVTFGSPPERLSSQRYGLFEMRQLPSMAGWNRFRAECTVYGANERYVALGERIYRRPRAKRWRAALLWDIKYPNGRTHCMVLTGKTLLVGGNRQILALNSADGKELWKLKDFDSQIRSIAIANGHLLAATDTGRIYVYGAGTGAATHQKQAPTAPPKVTTKLPTPIARALGAQKVVSGLALVFGDKAMTTALTLLAQSRLQVVALLADEVSVHKERNRLAGKLSAYGSRISVMPESVLRGRSLPDYAFDVIIAGRRVKLGEAKTLYRALSPYGGLLHFVGNPSAKALGPAGIAASEISRVGGNTLIKRGRLEGAFDWNTEYRKDKRVKWPLELLWFGEPGPKLTQSGGLTPFAANGRNYLVARNHLFCLDAYNGIELWRRTIPYLWRHVVRAKNGPGAPKSLVTRFAATDDKAFLGVGDQIYELDAVTGRELKIYGAFKDAPRHSLNKPMLIEIGKHQAYMETAANQTEKDLFREDPNAKNILTVTVKAEAKDLVISMTPALLGTNTRYHVELFMDVRPPSARNSLYSKGAFHMLVHTGEGRLQLGNGPWHPAMSLQKKGERDLALRIPWASLSKVWSGAKNDFCLAIIVNHPSGKGFARRAMETRDSVWNPKMPRGTMRWFWSCDDSAYAVNNGWARFTRGPGSPAAHGPKALALASLPPEGTKWTQRPPINKDRGSLMTMAGTRTSALSLNEDPFTFPHGKGCGMSIYAENMLVIRSGTLGFYDFNDDSGMRHFGGVRAGCSVSMLPALGVVFASEGSPSCGCNYNFKCSLTMVPTTVRSNEDWALYRGTIAAGALFKAGYFNLGAPGDRRDKGGRLWLQYPRAPAHTLVSMPVPFKLDGKEMAPFRYNADRVKIAGTDRPWIYASGFTGVESATVELYISEGDRAMSFPVSKPPVLDATLDDDCWDGQYMMSKGAARAYVRHDDKALYIACVRERPVDRRGKAQPWKASGPIPDAVQSWSLTDKSEDAEEWNESGVDLYIHDGGSKLVIHLGRSITGASYDGLCAAGAIRKRKEKATDSTYAAAWRGASKVTDTNFVLEAAIPWATIEAAGLDRNRLSFNPFSRGLLRAAPVPTRGFRALWMDEKGPEPKRYNVSLHFADFESKKVGERVFDILLNGKMVAKDFDPATAGPGPRAVVKTFHVVARKQISVQLKPKTGATLLCGIEIVEETK